MAHACAGAVCTATAAAGTVVAFVTNDFCRRQQNEGKHERTNDERCHIDTPLGLRAYSMMLIGVFAQQHKQDECQQKQGNGSSSGEARSK